MEPVFQKSPRDKVPRWLRRRENYNNQEAILPNRVKEAILPKRVKKARGGNTGTSLQP
jgi:hypothetical protein